ncbi:MAG: Gfo/Idh/MocA family oxidoreductase [Phycisphaerae bacterium]|nr:Gfo/Idh/MocA family oxidoreductase [Phycisphaerae bacterium]
MKESGTTLTRRGVLKAAAATTLAATLGLPGAQASARGRGEALRVGVVGCGGRGTGAAVNMLEASPDARIVALGDVFADRLASCRERLADQPPERAGRVDIPDERCFTGFDAYRRVLGAGIDIAILATPPGFRPLHIEAAHGAGAHVFAEKPVAVDPAGVQRVIEASRRARARGLHLVAGTQRRHEACYVEAMRRIHDGDIGRVTGAAVYWNQGGLWVKARQPEWSDAECQIRNWLYYAWLSGDHIVEQHVHNLDVAHWALGEPPTRCLGMGGRQVRTGAEYGHAFDHFAVQYEYPDGRAVSSQCRQIDGCSGRVEEVVYGAHGHAVLASGRAEIFGRRPWRWEGEQENPYVSELKALVAAITGRGPAIHEGERIAHSTMMAVMGRLSAYSGKTLTWEKAMASTLDLMPPSLELGPMETPAVAVPGRTPPG